MTTRLKRIGHKLLGQRRVVQRPGAAPGRRASDHQPLRGWVPSFWLAGAIALVDWGIKSWVASSMPVGDFRVLVDGRVALWHVHNPAMILGLWGNLPLDGRKVLAILAALAAALLLVQVVGRAHRLPLGHRRWAWVFVGLIMGGMLGNLGERAIHWYVTDYLSLRWGDFWLPPGNVADIALFLSLPMALPVIVFELMGRARRGSFRPAHPPGRAHPAG